MTDPSIERFRRVVASAYASLDERREEINDLNVFPVADGDTGDNMALTMRAVIDELDRLNGRPLDDVGREEIVGAVARAALMGARGNSGVILSQIVRGAAAELASRPGELVDPQLVSAAISNAVNAAYESVQSPVEGTMLTVLREMSNAIAQRLAHMERSRLRPDAGDAEQDALLAEILEVAMQAGEAAVDRTPQQLQVLADAGVVDAGAYGLVLMLAGAVTGLRGDGADVPAVAHHEAAPLAIAEHADSRYRYCVNFVVTGEGLASREFVGSLEALGDSVAVVGDASALRVHVHTDDPSGITALVGAIVLGPRIGKYNKDGTPNPIPGHNIPMAILGTFILAFGWFGFNPGSTLAGGGSPDLRDRRQHHARVGVGRRHGHVLHVGPLRQARPEHDRPTACWRGWWPSPRRAPSCRASGRS